MTDKYTEYMNIVAEMDGELLAENLVHLYDDIEIAKRVLSECWNDLHEENRIIIIRSIGESEKFDLIMFIHELIAAEQEHKMITTMFSVWKRFPFSTMIEPLQAYLEHYDNRIRADSIEILEKIEDDAVIDILRALLNDRDNRVRANAAKALWLKGDDGGFKVLKRMLRSANIWMRSSASYAISCIDAAQFFDVIFDALNDEFPSVREKIVTALSKVDNERSCEALLAVLKDEKEVLFIRKQAYEYLQNSSLISYQDASKKYARHYLSDIVIDDIDVEQEEDEHEEDEQNREKDVKDVYDLSASHKEGT